MHFSLRSVLFLLLALSTLLISLPLLAQQVIATINVGIGPVAVASNPVTNKIYVVDVCGNDPKCDSFGSVTVVDGSTDATTAVAVGAHPENLAVNTVTNKIYVSNVCGSDPSCNSPGTVTVIDGVSLTTKTLGVGFLPLGVAVNTVTNKIYVANKNDGTVTVIDGVSLTTTTVPVGSQPSEVAVNSATNKIYVTNSGGTTVSVIDGTTNNTTQVTVGQTPNQAAVNSQTNKIYVTNLQSNTVTVIDGATNGTSSVNVGTSPSGAAVNAVSNQIYVSNGGDGTVTVIDGATDATTSITVGTSPFNPAVDTVTNNIYVPNSGSNNVTVINGSGNTTTNLNVGSDPVAVGVNPATNRAYVVNQGDNTVSVIAGASAAALQFVAVTPCRLVDTRKTGGPIPGGTSQSFPIPQEGGCNIPAAAAAYSLNVTVVPTATLAYLTIWPTGEDQPLVSTMNSLDGRIKANAAIVPAGYQGAVSIFVSDTTNVVLDIDGYFEPASGSTLAFYPLMPCRVLDTRNMNGALGGPFLSAGQERDFPVLESNCGIPNTAQAYSMNFTVVPVEGQPLGYLTVWPQGSQRPVVSTLNNLTATIVANAAIVPAGTGGGIATYPDQNTQLVADIDGYFAPAGQNGLSLYPVAPCRVLDTRKVGNGQPFSGELTVDVVDSKCAPPAQAQSYVLNATVVPVGPLGYLTLWPDGEMQPLASTLNALDGAITSNMAIVPTTNGSIDAYAAGITQLILDISSYFAP